MKFKSLQRVLGIEKGDCNAILKLDNSQNADLEVNTLVVIFKLQVYTKYDQSQSVCRCITRQEVTRMLKGSDD